MIGLMRFWHWRREELAFGRWGWVDSGPREQSQRRATVAGSLVEATVERGGLKKWKVETLKCFSFPVFFTALPLVRPPNCRISPVQRQRSGRAAASKWEKLSTEYDEKMAGAREMV
jgi:hypothetical protein